jgi:DNA-binding winged helix-turn-helix (wHTH) protein
LGTPSPLRDTKSRLGDGYLFRFGQFALDSRKRTLSRADSPASLTPKAFDVLLFLAQNPNRLVTKEELLQAVWGDTFVEEGNLKQYISHLRKALGDNSEDLRLIVTIARKGYQFTADVTVVEAVDTAKQAAVQVPNAKSSLADRQPALRIPAGEAVPKTPKHSRNAAVMGASAVLLIAVGFASWRHFQAMTRPSSQKIMLAVLPFENLTGDPNKEYLADGLTEETISQLGRLNPEQLGVIARTSVMGYKHKDERLDQIGRDLSVQYVLESDTPDYTARLYRLICSFRFRKSGVDPLNCVRQCSVSTMGSNFNATATFSATSILTGPLSVSGDMISNGASDTHHESASAIGKRTWPGL